MINIQIHYNNNIYKKINKIEIIKIFLPIIIILIITITILILYNIYLLIKEKNTPKIIITKKITHVHLN